MMVPFNLSGVSYDLPKWRVPPDMWTSATGVTFRDEYAERQNGTRDIYGTPGTAPLHLLNSDFGGLNYWLYAGDGDIYVTTAAGVHSDITPSAWPVSSPDSDKYTSTELNGVPIINYEGEEPVWWDRNTANVMTTLPDWPTNASCYAMRVFKDFMLAIGYFDGSNDFPDQLAWSDAVDPGNISNGTGDTWTPAASNLAGSLEFGDTPGGLIDGAPLRGNFVVYKQNSTYLLQFVGAPFVFSRRLLFTTSGIMARNCVAEVRGSHVVLTDSDVIIHDGQTMRSLIDRKTRERLFNEIDQDNFANSYVLHFESRDEVWICYPRQGQTYPTDALVWQVDHDKLSFRNLTASPDGYAHIAVGNTNAQFTARDWDSQAYTWDGGSADYAWNDNLSFNATYGAVAADQENTELHEQDVTDALVDGDIRSELVREQLDFGDPSTTKLVRAVWPRIEGEDGQQVDVQVGSQFRNADPISWSAAVPFTIGETRKIDTFAQGRYISLRFSATGGKKWTLPGFDVELAPSGGKY